MDIESNISNNFTGTSRDPEIHMRQRDRLTRDWHRSLSRFDPPTAESRSSRALYDAYHYESRKRPIDNTAQPPPQDVRAATPTTQATTPTQLFPCANCGGDHRATECDSLKCFTCQATFPTAAQRQAHYMSTHRRDPTNKCARFAPISSHPRNQYTPPSSPFLSRSATEMNNHSPYDSGYESTFSTASGPGQPPSSRGNSDIDDQVDRYIRDQRVATLINTSTDHSNTDNIALPHTTPITTTLPPNPSHIQTHRAIADHHRAIAEHHLAMNNDTDSDQPPPLIHTRQRLGRVRHN